MPLCFRWLFRLSRPLRLRPWQSLAGVADVDAVTVAVVRLVPHTVSPRSAACATLAAVAANTTGKIAVGAIIAGGRFAAEILLMVLGCFVAGAVALWMTFFLLPVWLSLLSRADE